MIIWGVWVGWSILYVEVKMWQNKKNSWVYLWSLPGSGQEAEDQVVVEQLYECRLVNSILNQFADFLPLAIYLYPIPSMGKNR